MKISFQKNLKAIREFLGLSQTELAERQEVLRISYKLNRKLKLFSHRAIIINLILLILLIWAAW